jgi:hypothetical protein
VKLKVMVPGHKPGASHAQALQTPAAPHAESDVPGRQVPLVAAEQQPPLQAWRDEHDVVHAPVVVSHACPVGQSLASPHPHVRLDRQTGPDVLVSQELHAPLVPHAATVVPAAQMPALQQPPLHG